MLKHQIQSDAMKALKEGKSETAAVLRLVLASSGAKEKEKRYKLAKENPSLVENDLAKQSELSDDEMIAALSGEIKKRKDAIALYEQGNRPELAQKEKDEIAVIQNYLPAQLSQEEIKKLVEESISAVGAQELKDMGKVMADLNTKIKGRADGGQVSKVVKELLSN